MDDTRIYPQTPMFRDQKQQSVVREVLETVILALIIFVVMHFSILPVSVDGPSMQPRLHTGDVMLVNLWAYRFGSPQRGDVIVFHPPDAPDQSFVKRIIGIPGDTITISPTAVYVDGTKLKEPYIAPLPPGGEENPTGAIPKLKLGPNQYFVMGDNRLNSRDSRFWVTTPVTRQMIEGKVQVVFWPLDTFGFLQNYANVFAGVKQP